jgi:DNA-binding beta-propeller fold protein YncE
MKTLYTLFVCLLAAVSTWATTVTPKGKLYLASSDQFGGSTHIVVIQGNSVTQFPQAYNPGHEFPIAVFGDIRTTGNRPNVGQGGQYTLSGTPTTVTYTLPSGMEAAADSTSDGNYNYLVDFYNLNVILTNRDFTNAVKLFSVSPMPQPSGITYDPVDRSLWISGIGFPELLEYSMNGTLLKTIDTGDTENSALAFDPSDGTLWVVNDHTGYLEQFSTSGQALGLGPYVGTSFGAEFNLAFRLTPTPEPGTLAIFGTGILAVAGVLRRKINL